MTKKCLIEILESYITPDNLQATTQSCLSKLKNTDSCGVDESNNYNLCSEHYYRIYAGRIKNPNGVALRTPGLPESTENFKSKKVMLKLISVILDGGSGHIAIWLSEDREILGCIEFLNKMNQ